MSPKFPKTCRAVTAPDVKQKLEIKEVPLEEPKEGEVLLKVEACGVCHSDWGTIQGDFGPL
jgi:D-arabinose 1-dehydrogenase-like Zn-dependent alcohol dehydrogenase